MTSLSLSSLLSVASVTSCKMVRVGRWARLLATALALLAAPRLAAQPEDAPVGVAVKIYACGTAWYDEQNDSAYVMLNGTFLASSPTANDAYATATTDATYCGEDIAAVLGPQGVVRVEPGKSYSMYVNSYNLYNNEGEVNIVAPPGYRVVMNHMERSRLTFGGGVTVVFELLPRSARHPGLAGLASSVASTEIEWRVSLGNLRNGASAGDLALVDTGTRADWAPIFTPAMLNYEPVSDEIYVERPSNTIGLIGANQVIVNVVTLTATSYEIRCYHPAQMQNYPRLFTGQPFATYRIEQGATATTLKFTKEIRNVTDATSNPPVARREFMTLARTGTWPAYTWTRSDWTLEGQTSLAETVVQSGGTTSARTESLVVRTPGAGTGALNLTRNYAVPLVNGVSVVGEVLSAETVGTGTGLTANFAYYTDTAQFGSFGYLKSATLPGGGWVAYDYYDTNISYGYRGGRVKYRYKPYLNAPATATRTQGQGEITYYEYTEDVFGVPTRPSLVETRVNGKLTAKTQTEYDDSSTPTPQGWLLSSATSTEYTSDAGNSLQTTVRYFSENCSYAFLRGQTYSITNPDGVKQSFVYEQGTWDGTNFTLPSYGYGGTASRISVVNGSATYSGSPSTPTGGTQLDPVFLVDGKSTKDVTIRDSRALVVRTESHVWKSNAWQLVAYTNYSYDWAGRLTSRVASNGATYAATYDGGLKTSETDEAGVTTNYTYDASGRVATTTRTGSGVIGEQATHVTYDAAGRGLAEYVGWGQAEQIVTARQYDDAGRLTLETPPGNYGAIAHTYDVANRAHTVTNAAGGTVTSTDYLDGRPYSTTGTATVASYHTYGVETAPAAIAGRRWHQVNTGSPASPRWSKSWTDWAGRAVRSEQPGFTGQPNIVAENFYKAATNQLIKTTKTGVAPTLYEYNALGQVCRSGLDVNLNGVLNLASSDRIADADSYLESYNGAWWSRSDTRTYPIPGNAASIVTSIQRTRLTGFSPAGRLSETQSVDAEGNVTIQTVDVNRAARTAVATTTTSGIAWSMVENSINGVSVSVTGFDGLTTSTTRDALLRTSAVTDSRGNTTSTAYVPGTGLTQTVTDASGATATTAYDTLGRASWQRDPRNHYTRYGYNLRGQLLRQWGDGALPVEYGYDATYGDRVTQSTFRAGTGWDGATWPAAPGAADTTTWTYDAPSGLLTTKTDAPTPEHPAGCSVTQTYNTAGQTATRTLARGVVTTYGYDSATGELLSQTYSDSTPAVTYAYGRTGQVETVADYTGTRDLVYDANKPWRLTAEAESAFYGNRTVTRMYDETGVIGRVHGFQIGASAGSNADLEQTFGFTTVGRFDSLTSLSPSLSPSSRTFRYGWLADAALLQSVAIDGNHPFTISRTYEAHRNLVTSLDAKWSTTLRTGYAYAYDERGQRTQAVQSGDAFADYGAVTSRQFAYDGRGQLTADIGYLGSDIAQASQQLPGRRFEYAYDTAGNRQTANRTGVAGLEDHYTTNALNQYTTRENNTLSLSGTAAPETDPVGGAGGTAVTVQGGTLAPVAASRKGGYWNSEITVDNNHNPLAPNPWRGPVTIFTAKRGASGAPDAFRADARMAEIAARLQTFEYDLDGNLTSDGIADYQWDAENRLVRIETTPMAQTWGFPHRLLEFRYDYMGRRVLKRVLSWNLSLGTWNLDSERRYLYDGWNLVAEYSVSPFTFTLTLTRSYTWGLDIVNSQTNAGGVGALLQIADHASGKTYLPTYDGNGNVAALLNADTGALAAAYEYSPYGEPLRSQILDSTISDQPFRFSTKFTDLETGLVYYGHRYYSPSLGRFINRDPIEESGGLNLYGFCGNNGVNRWDVLGMVVTDHWISENDPNYGNYNELSGGNITGSRFDANGVQWDCFAYDNQAEMDLEWDNNFIAEQNAQQNQMGLEMEGISTADFGTDVTINGNDYTVYDDGTVVRHTDGGKDITFNVNANGTLSVTGDYGNYTVALAPNSVTLAAQAGTPGATTPVFNANDVAGVMNGTAPGQALLGRLKSDFAVKTADVYTGRDANGNLISATGLIGGYAKGTSNPAVIIINNLATTNGGFNGSNAQFYTYVLIQEVNEFDLFRANTPGTNKQVEVINRVNAENQARAMGLPEAQPGYRTASGAVDVSRITQDVASNPGYTGPTHGGTYIVRNGVLVKWP